MQLLQKKSRKNFLDSEFVKKCHEQVISHHGVKSFPHFAFERVFFKLIFFHYFQANAWTFSVILEIRLQGISWQSEQSNLALLRL